MKKLPFFLAISVAVALAAAFILHLISDSKKTTVTTGSGALPLDENSEAGKTFKGFNYNLLLKSDTHNGEAEITLLQHLINAYYGVPTVFVTGKYDSATASAITAITKKSSITLYQFRYYYFVQVRGEAKAIEIINSLTENRA